MKSLKKQVEVITNQNERLATLAKKDDDKYIYEEIFDKLVKEAIDRIKELTYEVDHDHFKGDTAKCFLMILIMIQNFLEKYNLVKWS